MCPVSNQRMSGPSRLIRIRVVSMPVSRVPTIAPGAVTVIVCPVCLECPVAGVP